MSNVDKERVYVVNITCASVADESSKESSRNEGLNFSQEII